MINHGEIIYDNSLKEMMSMLKEKKNVRLTTQNKIAHLTDSGISIIKKMKRLSIAIKRSNKMTLHQMFCKMSYNFV